ncbi:MAG: TonB family protein [Lysobacterales bacterium]
MRRLLLGMVLALVAFAAQAGERWMGFIQAEVEIDAQGRASTVKLLHNRLSKAMRATLIERIRAVEFEPAVVDGQPAPAAVTISVVLGVNELPDALQVVIDDIAITVGTRKATPPRYPMRELERGESGMVTLRVAYDADGRVIEATPADPGARRDAFMIAALRAASRWQLEPQRVAGIGVAGTAIIPVLFTIADEAPEKSGSGVLRFQDGGSLNVSRRAQDQWELADSRVRVRSLEGAREAIGGS